MDAELLEQLREMERSGRDNDAATQDRSQKMLNITHDTGVFLALLVKAARCRNVLEIGTSNGYSTLWLADAVGDAGTVTTVDQAENKVELAARNFHHARLTHRIRQIHDEAGRFLATCPDAAYDFLFLDSERGQYVAWWSTLQRVLQPGCLVVVDNATSHAHELEAFRRAVAGSPGCLSSLVPIGNGELVILKEGGPA
jgi:predicted O-methyltransferase YrrM